MFALIEVALMDGLALAPEFALLAGAADLRRLRPRRRLTIRSGRWVEIREI